MKKSKKIKLWAIIGSLILIAFVYALYSYSPPPKVGEIDIPLNYEMSYPPEYNFRQTINDCGPFNVAAVIRVLKKEEISSKTLSEEMEWRLPNDYTLPWGVEKQLEQYGINIKIPNVASLSESDKLNYLMEQLSLNKPIIILGAQEGLQHYITLLGYDKNNEIFYVYNPLLDKGEEGMTVDNNAELPGNAIMSNKDIINFWKGGGMYGVYEWYLIVSSIS